jgi:hypothetical protein
MKTTSNTNHLTPEDTITRAQAPLSVSSDIRMNPTNTNIPMTTAEITSPRNLQVSVRPLGSLEQLFWLMDQHRPVHFVLAAQISGVTSLLNWRKALDAVQACHPLLSARINHTDGSAPHFQYVHNAPIPLREVYGEPDQLWQTEVAEEMATRFDPSQAPLIRAVLIKGRDKAAFIVAAHHSIADGFSIACVIRDTLCALGDATLMPQPMPPALEAVLGVLGQPPRPNGRNGHNGLSLREPSVYRPLDGARPKIHGLRLTVAETARLRERSRREGTTVHGALCAAYVLAARESGGDWQDIPLRILSPVNARGILALGERLGLFVSVAAGTFDGRKSTFWALAREAREGVALAQMPEHIREITSGIQHFIDGEPDVPATAEFAAHLFAREMMITNLGPLPCGARLGPVRLEALWGPAVLGGLEDEHTIGAATAGGSLCVTYTSYTPRIGLLETMQEHLRLAAL